MSDPTHRQEPTPLPPLNMSERKGLDHGTHAIRVLTPKQREEPPYLKVVPIPPGGFCDKQRRDGYPCSRQAGHGTDHVGVGPCSVHDAEAKRQRAQLMNEHVVNDMRNGRVRMRNGKKVLAEAHTFYGAPKDINPMEAIIWMIKIAAGEVQWLSDKIAEVSRQDWIEETVVGRQVHLWVRERQNAMDRLARYAKWAIDAGIAERQVRVMEVYGESIARMLRGILNELELTAEQRDRAPDIVRRHLIAIEGGQAS
jgi:hypothetical protein